MVVVPTLLTSVPAVTALVEHLEVLALREPRPADPPRDPQRLRRRHRVRDAGRRGDPRSRPAFHGTEMPWGVTGSGMIGSMRVKTSVTIDERVLRGIDKVTSRARSRSRVIEDAAREFLARRARAARESRDLEILDRSADALNREMDDVLAYQADV